MAKEKITVFFDVKSNGRQAEATWAEKELLTGTGKEESAGYKLGTAGSLIVGKILECKMVTIEANGEAEACEAVTTWLTKGITNPAKSAPAVPAQGTGGGFANNKALAVKTSSLKEEALTP